VEEVENSDKVAYNLEKQRKDDIRNKFIPEGARNAINVQSKLLALSDARLNK